ncbi:chromosome partitioning protein ParA [uncultured Vibrio sp.]|uniref:chromosome partitioning protein ParA n=1 Tax=uncultured Vibrio sp. TaxID=114054 RepID=UPI000911BE18|nr:chromosome partitioning protein ParA [uncultured Vibrio sp.]OIQ26483.1 MAG: chromosome partitioning protein ParA [Vibrio sp. MedPE-SWchi]
MSKQDNIEQFDGDDVVVVEERDKRTYIYIVIACLIGLALGGLIGSATTAKKWEQTYHLLEAQYQHLLEDKKQLIVKVEEKVAKIDDTLAKKMEQELASEKEKHKLDISKLEELVAELEKVNLSLEAQIATQTEVIADADTKNNRLSRQADMQASMFERSRELFQKELRIKQEVESLEQEREKLLPVIETLKAQCDVYLEGTSWDAKSDSCDKQDEANSRLSQVNQMLQVHRMDLKQIEALSDELGL